MTTGASDFEELNEGKLRRLFSINPDCATIWGMHDPYDKLLPHGGFQKIKGNLDLLTEWVRGADAFASRAELSRDQQVSLQVLHYTLGTYRFAVEDYSLWKMRPEALGNPGTAMLMMIVRDYAPMHVRLESIAARIGEMPRYLEQFRDRFKGARTVRIWTEAAIEMCKAFPAFLDTAEKLARANPDSDLGSDMAKSVSGLRESLPAHEEWLMKMLDSSQEGFAMGKVNFEKMLRIRGISYTPQGLLDLAYAQLDEFKTMRESVAERISNGGTVDEARRFVEDECPQSVAEVVERTKAAVERARSFVIEQDLATVLDGPRVLVMETPDFLAGSTPIASTYLPAVFEESQDTVFLVSGGQGQEDLGSWHNYAGIDTLAVHEAYPGHHHQGTMSNRKPWVHQLPHIMYSPETLSPPYESQEGWATYCEQLMVDHGFMASDHHLLGLLDYRILMACRTISEVKLSCEDATLEDMIEMTAREVGRPWASAEADVKGFTRNPGYGICYLLGRHLVMQLKRALAAEQGSDFSEKRFHDLVAENGNLPFYLLEREVRQDMGLPGRD